MSNKDLLDNIKKLRELTGVGFKDCKLALDESEGDIEKSIEFLRKKGIAKASKKMSRTASEGLSLVKEKNNEISIIEINSETDLEVRRVVGPAVPIVVAEAPWSVAEWAVAPRCDNPRATVLVLVLG